MFEEEKIIKVITSCFQNFFTSQKSNPLKVKEVIEAAIKPVITEEMNQALIKEPTAEEIKQAMFSIHPDKAP